MRQVVDGPAARGRYPLPVLHHRALEGIGDPTLSLVRREGDGRAPQPEIGHVDFPGLGIQREVGISAPRKEAAKTRGSLHPGRAAVGRAVDETRRAGQAGEEPGRSVDVDRAVLGDVDPRLPGVISGDDHWRAERRRTRGSRRSGTEWLPGNRVDLARQAGLDGHNTQEFGGHGNHGEPDEPDHRQHRRRRYTPPPSHVLTPPPQTPIPSRQHRLWVGAGNRVNYRNLYSEIPDAAQLKTERRTAPRAPPVFIDDLSSACS